MGPVAWKLRSRSIRINMNLLGSIEYWWRMRFTKPIKYYPGMTLRPGQSANLGIELPTIINGVQVSWSKVPPPDLPPTQSVSGLIPGLRIETKNSEFRCCCCNRMQPASTNLVWVPDSIHRGDSKKTVLEACRLNMYNGNHSGWCEPCARALGSN